VQRYIRVWSSLEMWICTPPEIGTLICNKKVFDGSLLQKESCWWSILSITHNCFLCHFWFQTANNSVTLALGFCCYSISRLYHIFELSMHYVDLYKMIIIWIVCVVKIKSSTNLFYWMIPAEFFFLLDIAAGECTHFACLVLYPVYHVCLPWCSFIYEKQAGPSMEEYKMITKRMKYLCAWCFTDLKLNSFGIRNFVFL